MAHLHFFPAEALALQEELQYHPDLQRQLMQDPSNELELRLGRIAAYCEIIMDGYYDNAQLVALCGILAERLKKKRTIIIN